VWGGIRPRDDPPESPSLIPGSQSPRPFPQVLERGEVASGRFQTRAKDRDHGAWGVLPLEPWREQGEKTLYGSALRLWAKGPVTDLSCERPVTLDVWGSCLDGRMSRCLLRRGRRSGRSREARLARPRSSGYRGETGETGGRKHRIIHHPRGDESDPFLGHWATALLPWILESVAFVLRGKGGLKWLGLASVSPVRWSSQRAFQDSGHQGTVRSTPFE
jgi:hypothetical protein